ncbi:hypothetical protein M3Y99_00697000 [Aphelenchoides fujianensis]|nr:hypothetical protein M3Y99_00697000 [Aphelenchoides fujianensis]
MSAQYKNSSNWPADEPPLYARQQQKRTAAEKEVRFPRNIGQETVRKQRGVLTDQDLDDLRIPADPVQPSCGHFRPAASHIKMWLADGFREWCPECNKLTGQNVIRPNSERSGKLKYLKSLEEKRQLEIKSEVDTQTTASDPWLTASEEKSWTTSSDYTPVNPDYNDDAIRSIWPPEQRASLLTNFQRRQLEAAAEQQRLVGRDHVLKTFSHGPTLNARGLENGLPPQKNLEQIWRSNQVPTEMDEDSGTEDEPPEHFAVRDDQLAAHHQLVSRVMEVIDDKTSSDELSSDSEYRRAIRDHPLPMPGQRDVYVNSAVQELHGQQHGRVEQPSKKAGLGRITHYLNPFKSSDKHHSTGHQQHPQHPPLYPPVQHEDVVDGRHPGLLPQHFQHSISDRQPVQIPLDAYGRPVVNNRAANHIAHPRDPHLDL